MNEPDIATSLRHSRISVPALLTNVIRWVKPRPIRILSKELYSRMPDTDA
jgi:hypothetical protein